MSAVALLIMFLGGFIVWIVADPVFTTFTGHSPSLQDQFIMYCFIEIVLLPLMGRNVRRYI